MAQEEKPIFPRSSESSEAEKEELRRKTKLNLETEEKRFEANYNASGQKIFCSNCQTESSATVKFCRVCGNNLSLPPVIAPPILTDYPRDTGVVYGPPPMRLKDEPDDDIHTTAYGPPPMNLATDLPTTTPHFRIEKEPYPPSPPTPAPVYGPPPMMMDKQKKNKILWLAIGLILGFLIASVIFIIFITSLFLFR